LFWEKHPVFSLFFVGTPEVPPKIYFPLSINLLLIRLFLFPSFQISAESQKRLQSTTQITIYFRHSVSLLKKELRIRIKKSFYF